jgi:hypothetical protein
MRKFYFSDPHLSGGITNRFGPNHGFMRVSSGGDSNFNEEINVSSINGTGGNFS